MTIGAVSFGNEPQQKKSSALPVATTLAGGAIGAFAIKEKITSKDVLKKDTFELGKSAEDADKAVAAKITEKIPGLKDDKLGTAADAEVTDAFKKAKGEKLTAEEYLGKSKEDFKADITKAEGETKAKQTAVDEAKTKLDKADDAGKEAAKAEHTKLVKELDAHTAKIDADKATLEFAEKSKEGITKDALKAKTIEDLKNAGKKEIDDLIGTLKKIPKKASIKMGLIAAGVGLVLGVLLNGGSKKAPHAEEAKA